MDLNSLKSFGNLFNLVICCWIKQKNANYSFHLIKKIFISNLFEFMRSFWIKLSWNSDDNTASSAVCRSNCCRNHTRLANICCASCSSCFKSVAFAFRDVRTAANRACARENLHVRSRTVANIVGNSGVDV